jgi:hypothetical protein
VFTARYALSPYTKQTRFVLKGLNIRSPVRSCELQHPDSNTFSKKYPIFKVPKQPLGNTSLGETNIKHSKITCRNALDIRPGITESAVDFNSTLASCGLKLLRLRRKQPHLVAGTYISASRFETNSRSSRQCTLLHNQHLCK